MPDSNKDSPSDSKEKDNAQYLKRREQVRRAQRTHRERKEAYIKSLENEVLQLRNNETKILQESRSLYTEVARLKRILEQNGIPYEQAFTMPSHPSDSSSAPSLSSVSILSNPHNQQQLHVQGLGSTPRNQFYLSESDGSSSSGVTESSKGLRQKLSFFRSSGRSEADSQDGGSSTNEFLSTGQPAAGADISAVAASASNLSLRDMDQNNLGMEFVLSLEAPCLHHTQGESSHRTDPTGHALTASAPLLFQAPTQPVDTSTSRSGSWEIPNLGLDRLLSLSSNFELTDEITPVQAWHQIRSHPDFENVEVGGLRRLTEDMLKHVKCYGFGAVVETSVFANLVKNVFPRGGFAFDEFAL